MTWVVQNAYRAEYLRRFDPVVSWSDERDALEFSSQAEAAEAIREAGLEGRAIVMGRHAALRRDVEPHELGKGEYGRSPTDGVWYCHTPGPGRGFLGNLSGHDVTEHEDGTITVAPSILIQLGHAAPSWHGYLERGEWREC